MGVNKIIYGGKTLVDMTDATATPETVLEGYTAYGANGARIVGTASATKRREQTVSVSGVTADATVIIGGTPGSDYNEFEAYCSEQGSGTLTFTAPYQPNGDLTANAVILT